MKTKSTRAVAVLFGIGFLVGVPLVLRAENGKKSPPPFADSQSEQTEGEGTQTLPPPNSKEKAKKAGGSGTFVSSDGEAQGEGEEDRSYKTDIPDCQKLPLREERVECLLTQLAHCPCQSQPSSPASGDSKSQFKAFKKPSK